MVRYGQAQTTAVKQVTRDALSGTGTKAKAESPQNFLLTATQICGILTLSVRQAPVKRSGFVPVGGFISQADSPANLWSVNPTPRNSKRLGRGVYLDPVNNPGRKLNKAPCPYAWDTVGDTRPGMRGIRYPGKSEYKQGTA